MATAIFKTSGFRELENALLELATRDAKRIATRALKDAAAPIADAYAGGTTVKTGALRDSVMAGPHSRLNRRQKRLNRRPGPSEVLVYVGTANPAGIQEEFGIRQAANPALTRAWDREGGETALRRIGDELGAGLERAAKRRKKG